MQLSDKQLFEELKAGKYRPVYLLTGEENYYIDITSDYFENHIISEESRDFDRTILYCRPSNLCSSKRLRTSPSKNGICWPLICSTPCRKHSWSSATATRNSTNAPKPTKPSTTTDASASAPNSTTTKSPYG